MSRDTLLRQMQHSLVCCLSSDGCRLQALTGVARADEPVTMAASTLVASAVLSQSASLSRSTIEWSAVRELTLEPASSLSSSLASSVLLQQQPPIVCVCDDDDDGDDDDDDDDDQPC